MNTVWSMWMNYEHDFVIKVRSYSHKANVHSDNWLQPGQHSEIKSARSQSAVLTPVQEVCRYTLTCTFFIDNQKWSTKALTWLNNSPQWICGNAKTGKRGNTRQNWTLIHPRDSDALNAVEESVSTGSTYPYKHYFINVSNRRHRRTTSTCMLRVTWLDTSGALRCIQLTPPTMGTIRATHGGKKRTGTSDWCRNSRLTIPEFLHKAVNATISSHNLWCRLTSSYLNL